MDKCVNCKSDSLEVLSSHHLFTKEYIIKEGQTTKSHQSGYMYDEVLCMDCGLVFRAMPKKELESYNRFKNKYLVD